MEPIAIIGIGCRFPGASGPNRFWRLLRDGIDAIGEVPPDRWRLDRLYDPDPTKPGKMSTRWGGFVDGIDQFDPQFFHISPREAAFIDPQQRMLLEVAWEALEDADQVPERLAGSPTGVFVGISTSDYGSSRSQDPLLMSEPHAALGGALSIAANRLSYVFDFRGPSLAVDTACSSSLLAVHLACESLARGECDLALAGGVNALVTPGLTITFSKGGFMAPDGRCKAFDAAADGYVRGEGAGLVVLKPLVRARADGDPIYAIVRGSATNQDGRSNGLTAPNRFSQEVVLRAAYARAGVEPSRVAYVEAHGTGTPLGDPIEAQALGAVLGEGRPPERPCALGSVKTNLGHLEAAAGIAGLIKVALAFHHGQLPASLHFHQPSPHIPFDRLNLRVQSELGPWPTQPDSTAPAIAGVSSFGFGGTNVHIVVESASPVAPPATLPASRAPESAPTSEETQLVLLSAHQPSALDDLTRSYVAWLSNEQEEDGAPPPPPLSDIARASALRRTHHEYRLAVVASSHDELRERLSAHLAGEAGSWLAGGRAVPGRRPPKTVFVFPGQGSHWDERARDLALQEPVFREALERCDAAIRRHADWSVLSELEIEDTSPESSSRHIDVVQPSLFAIQVALAALWRSWGVEPDAVIGHSMGEVGAAHVAGLLSLDDAARVICRRSRLMRRLSGRGRMAAVKLSVDEARDALDGYADRVAVAAVNGPRSTILSGDEDALEAVLTALDARGVFCRWVNVDVASHSPQMDALRDDLLAELDGLSPHPGTVRLYSTVTGQIADYPDLGPGYWVQNLRQPVLFAPTVERLLADGHTTFLELSPQPLMTVALQQTFQQGERDAVALASLRRGEPAGATIRATLGALHTLGHAIDWSGMYRDGGRSVSLPPYPWQHQRCWVEPVRSLDLTVASGTPNRETHPLLGTRLDLAQTSGSLIWESVLSEDRLPYLWHHRVQGTVVLPATAYTEIGLAAASETFGAGPCTLADLKIDRPLLLTDGGRRRLQIVAMTGTGGGEIKIYSQAEGASGAWTLHATGRLEVGVPEPATEASSLTLARIDCTTELAGTAYYQRLDERGLQYGPAFQGLHWLWHGDAEVLGEIRAPDDVEQDRGYLLHPALLDAAGQPLLHGLPPDGRVYVPVQVDRVRFYGRPAGPRLWSHARFRSTDAGLGAVFGGDLRVMDEDGSLLLEAAGLQFQSLDLDQRRATPTGIPDWLYELEWVPADTASGEDTSVAAETTAGRWLIFANGAGVGDALARELAGRGGAVTVVTAGAAFGRQSDGTFEIDPDRPDDMSALLQAVLAEGRPGFRGIVHLWSLDAPALDEHPVETIEQHQRTGSLSVLHLVQALAARGPNQEAPRLWLVTSGVHAVGEEQQAISIAQAPLWGLGATIAQESPPLRCTRVDLGAPATDADMRALVRALGADDREDQIAFRGGSRFVARLRRRPDEPGTAEPVGPLPTSSVGAPDETVARRLESASPGVLEHLVWNPLLRRAPGSGEVEIEVAAAALNFQDVLGALGLWQEVSEAPLQLGSECAGRIVAVGSDVDGLQVGDEVVAIAPSSLSTFVTAPIAYVVRKPDGLSLEEAVTIPIAFLTAHYALNHLGRLAKGERVLIHSAAGGVGLAAVQLAQLAGAEVFATAGSPEKRAFLESLGVRHVFNSRSLDFADQISAATAGEGVDVVLNALTGEASQRSLDLLRPYGRFLEIGKRDIYQNASLGLRPFRRNLSYFAIDLSRLLRDQPALGSRLYREIVQLVEADQLRPLASTVFSGVDAPAAFRYMAQARHIGKVVLTPADVAVSGKVDADGPSEPRLAGTYLITGGLGGLGLTIAEQLVKDGAHHLVLVGRNAPSEHVQAAIRSMEQAGAEVRVAHADVSDAGQLSQLLVDLSQGPRPLRGIVHAAGNLDDATLLQLDRSRVLGVMAPKIDGAWHLHRLTLDIPLDFFIMFSSAASVLGAPGQGNYAAANAFMDALAWHRRAGGRPALSINWGPWSEVGLAARPNRAGRLATRGLTSISPALGARTFAHLLDRTATQVAVLPPDVGQWLAAEPSFAEVPLVSELIAESDIPDGPRRAASSLLATLGAAPPEQRAALIELHLREQIARVLGLPVDAVEPDRPLETLGFDSLMTVGFGNRLKASLGRTVPAAEVWKHPSVGELSAYLAETLDQPEPASAEPAAEPANSPSAS